MSIRVMTKVWDNSRQKEGTLLVLLAIADFANDDGLAYPSMKTIAKKARMTIRNAQLAVRRLERAGELIVTIGGAPPPYTGCNLFRVTLATGVQETLPGGEASDTKGVKPTSSKPSPIRHLTVSKNDFSKTRTVDELIRQTAKAMRMPA
jgi:Helix-turn-helix domain